MKHKYLLFIATALLSTTPSVTLSANGPSSGEPACSHKKDVNKVSVTTSLGQTLYYLLDSDNLTATLVPETDSSPYYTAPPSGDLTIPSIVEHGGIEYNVTSIGDFALAWCRNLNSVTIPNTVTSIGEYAFTQSKLTSVSIPEGLLSIGRYAFDLCTDLSTITIPNTVTRLGEHAFDACIALTSAVLGNGITAIPDESFLGCSALTTVSLPGTLVSIGSSAFEGCHTLASVTIPSHVSSIGHQAFFECTNISQITILATVPPATNASFPLVPTDIPVLVPCGTLSLYQAANGWSNFSNIQQLPITEFDALTPSLHTLHFQVNDDAASVTITGHQDSISGHLVIPSTVEHCNTTFLVTSIATRAFASCSTLTAVTLPPSITSVGFHAFENCYGLAQTNYTGTLNTWMSIQFSSYASTPVYYSKNLFINGTELTTLVIPDNITEIKPFTFQSCYSLTGHLNIPNTVTSIGESAFSDCPGLTSISLPRNITTISEGTFNSCSGLSSILIPNSVTRIESSAFRHCTNITSVVIPDSVTYIGERAFGDCSRLTTVTIGPSVQEIVSAAFYPCNALQKVYLYPTTPPAFLRSNPFIYYNPFFGGSQTFYVPCGTADAYHQAFSFPISDFVENWTPYNIHLSGNPAHMASSTVAPLCTSSVTITATPNCGYRFLRWENAAGVTVSTDNPCTLSVSSDTSLTAVFEALPAVDYAESPSGHILYYRIMDGNAHVTWQTRSNPRYTDLNGDLVIPDSVTLNCVKYKVASIRDSAFFHCTGLTSVVIPNTVSSIGNNAFEGCRNMASVNIPNLVTKIKTRTFCECGLTSVVIPNSVTEIGRSAFHACGQMASVTIPNSVTSIAMEAFRQTSLTTVTIPNSVRTIGDAAFAESRRLESVTISNSVTKLEYWVFMGCSSLSSITIPGSVTSISTQAFSWCGNMTSIEVESGNEVYDSRDNCNAIIETASNKLVYGCMNTIIPNTVTSIGDEAFNSCNRLSSITIPSAVNSIGNSAFLGCTGLTEITTLATIPPTLGSNAFSNVPADIPLLVPCGSLSDYQSATGWSNFTNLQAYNSYTLTAVPADDLMGTAAVTTQPTCTDSTATITATPNEGYRFDHWSDGNSDNPRTVTVTSDTSFTAFFSPLEIPCREHLPFFENLDNSTTGKLADILPCWTLVTPGSTTLNYVCVASSHPYSPSNHLHFSYSSPAGCIVALPAFEDEINSLELSFMHRPESNTNSSCGTFKVGYITDTTDPGSFVPVAEWLYNDFDANEYRMEIVGFPNAPAGARIALWHMTPDTNNWYWFVDDINVHKMPTCHRPEGVTVSNITTTTAHVSIADISMGNSYRIDFVRNDDTLTFTSNSTEYDAVGLTPGTTYKLYVQALCSDGTTTLPVATTFNTQCSPITALPWHEDFDSRAYLYTKYATRMTQPVVNCWDFIAHNSDAFMFLTNESHRHGEYGFSLGIYPGEESAKNIAVLPEFSDDISGLELTCWTRPELPSSKCGSVDFGYITDLTDTSTFVSMVHYNFSDFNREYKQLYVTFPGAPSGARIAIRHNTSVYNYYWFVDDIYVHTAPGCSRPTVEVSDITQSSATVTLSDAENTNHYGLVINGDSVEVYGNTYSLTGLYPNTFYTVNAYTICSDGSSTFPVTTTFLTPCEAIVNLPWSEDFESQLTNNVPECWDHVSPSFDSYNTLRVVNNNPHEGSNCIRFSYSQPSGNVVAFPVLGTDIVGLELSFWHRPEKSTNSKCGTLEVGYITNVADASTFVATASYAYNDFTSNLYRSDVVHFPGAPSGARIAFRHIGTGENWYWFVDDIDVHTDPGCVRPDVAVSNITQTSAEISLADDNNVNHYRLYLNDGATTDSVEVTGNTYTFNNLIANTQYTIEARTLCSGGALTVPASASFLTPCEAIVTLPWSEDFESQLINNVPECWNHVSPSSSSFKDLRVYNYYSHEGSNCLRFNYSQPSGNVVALPAMDTDIDNLELSFWHCPGDPVSTDCGTLEVGYITNVADAGTFVATASFAHDDFTSDLYRLDVAHFSGAPSGARIAFRHNGTANHGTWYIDDIDVHLVPGCLYPSVSVSNITGNSAEISLSDDNNVNHYRLYLSDGTTSDTLEVTGNTYTLNNLIANTKYTLHARTLCDDGTVTMPASTSFLTPCETIDSLPWNETFDDWSVKSSCWRFLKGAYNGGNGPAQVSSSAWSLSSSYGNYIQISGKALTMNIYSSNQYWAVTPPLNLSSDNVVLKVDIAVSAWSDSTPNHDDNDTLAFALSTDGGNTFTNLLSLDGTALNALRNEYTTIEIPVSGYNGRQICFAVYGGSTGAPGDNRIAIDNLSLSVNNTPAPATYTLTVSSADQTMGTVTGGGIYEMDSTATITATPNEGYRFDHWNDSNSDNPRTVTVTSDTSFVAEFVTTPATWTQTAACPGWNNPASFTAGGVDINNYSGRVLTNTSGYRPCPDPSAGSTGLGEMSDIYNASQLASIVSTSYNCNPSLPNANIQFQIISDTLGYDPNTGNNLRYVPVHFNTNDNDSGAINTHITKSIRIGDLCGGSGAQLNYTTRVTPDNAVMILYYALVAESPDHEFLSNPMFIIRAVKKDNAGLWQQISDSMALYIGSTAIATNNTCPNMETPILADPRINGWHKDRNGNIFLYKDWDRIGFDLSNYLYDTIQIQIFAYDCAYTAHSGYAYIAGECRPMGYEVPQSLQDTLINIHFEMVGDSLFSQDGLSMIVANQDESFVKLRFDVVPTAERIEVYDRQMNLVATFQNSVDAHILRMTTGLYTIRAVFPGGNTFEGTIDFTNDLR